MRMIGILVIGGVALATASVILLTARDMEKEGGNVKPMVVVRPIDEHGQLTDLQRIPKVVKTDAEWRRQLTSEQYRVARGKDTERPFCGAFHAQKEAGIYTCVCCGLPLFKSDAKFESGTGWPSFFAPVARENISERQDLTLGTQRIEILCTRCDAHLGHVFDDGPAPTGLRYCLNSAALRFAPAGSMTATPPRRLEKATFAAGCFWHVEEVFRQVKGVVDTQVGYTGGTLPNPTYKDVRSHTTGHAEAVEVEYDPSRVSYEQLLKVFWENHNPTTLNRQGPDHGDQYRSAIFCHTPQQREVAMASKKQIESSDAYDRPVVTQIVPATNFWRAEEHHQRYAEKQGINARPVN